MTEKILIVDDSADLRTSLAFVLGSLFTVFQASNGAEALVVLEKERPRLMLLDIAMPGMSGLEVLEAAKKRHPEVIVVMLTSHQDVEIAALALNLGADEYITKPFDAVYIRAEVSRLSGPADSSDDKPWKVAE
jgi:DNA-binding response OmpR family regulator